MIQKQYDQLLEICEQTKAEVADLSKEIDETDFTRILEIERTEALIASIEHDVQAKKQDVYDIEIKNRYEQLYSTYETTKKEVEILENLLQNNSSEKANSEKAESEEADCVLDEAHYVKMNQDPDLSLSQIKTDEMLTSHQFSELKRERLNLSSSNVSLNLSKSLHLEDDMMAAKLEHLESMPLTLDKKKVQTTHRFDKEPNMQEQAISDQPMPAPILPELPKAPERPPMVPELSSLQLKAEIKSNSKSNETNHQVTQKKSPLNKKKGISALYIIFKVMLYFVLVFSVVFVMLFGNRNPEAIPRNVRGYSVMRVATGSMEPTISVNSLIVTRKTNLIDLQIGDIVTYETANNTTVTHRIYEIIDDHTPGERGFILKGDALDEPDTEVVAGQHIIGHVIFISYSFGRAYMFFQDYSLLLVALVILSLVMLFVLQRKTKDEGNQS